MSTEERKVREVARDYEQRGYKVTIQPDRSTLPDFLSGLRPDVLATSKRESVVIEVRSTESMSESPDLYDIASKIEVQEGWRFELVVTNPREPKRTLLDAPKIRKRLQEVQMIRSKGSDHAGLIYAWSATEAALNRLLEEVENRTKPLSSVILAKTLYSLGMIAPSDYEFFKEAAEIRNVIVHGMELGEQGYSDADVQRALNMLIQSTQKICDRLERKKALDVDEMIEWFKTYYDDPANGVPRDSGESGYQYVLGGPYDARDELSSEFPDTEEALIDEAAKILEQETGNEWIRKEQD